MNDLQTCSANSETSKVSGSLETKYRWVEYGLMFTEKWNTDNTLGTEITLEDQVSFGLKHAASRFSCDNVRLEIQPVRFFSVQLARGLKLTFDSSFSPNTG
uniref:Voltage-dependent anion-selective channel protein 1 n=1 Tax=Pavo cristatus TaxID=9049 RepID=A0A8C9FTZ3_PAVCR